MHPTSLPPYRKLPDAGRHPYRRDRTLSEAAALGQLIIYRCAPCRNMVRFLASDLAEVLGPDWPVSYPGWPCSRCGNSETLRVDCDTPMPGDYGSLKVRRLLPPRVVRGWRDMLLGEDP